MSWWKTALLSGLGLVAAYAIGSRIVSSWENSFYQKGYGAAVAAANAARDKEDARNRDLEKQVQSRTDEFDNSTQAQRAELNSKELIYVDRIKETLKTVAVPADCRIPDSVLDDRNRIRDLGPAPEDAGTPPGNGEEGGASAAAD